MIAIIQRRARYGALSSPSSNSASLAVVDDNIEAFGLLRAALDDAAGGDHVHCGPVNHIPVK